MTQKSNGPLEVLDPIQPNRRAEVRIAAEEWTRAVRKMIWRMALTAGAVYGVIYCLSRLHAVITAIVVGSILAYIIRPIAGWMISKKLFHVIHRTNNHHTRRVIATLYVVVFLFIAVYGAGKIVITPFIKEAQKLSTNYPALQEKWKKTTTDFLTWYNKSVPEGTRKWIDEKVLKSDGGSQLDFKTKATAWGQQALQTIANSLKNVVEVVLLPVLAFYFALDSRKIKHEFVSILPGGHREVFRIIHEFNGIMNSYVIGQAILCLLAGVVVGLFLQWLGVEYALMLGFMAGITRAIPIIGPILGGIPIVGLALVSNGVGVALTVLAFFTFLHFAESKFIMPKLIGDRMELHPVVIIVVLLIGQEFGGLLGMFFAPPLAAIVRVMIRRYWLRRKPRSEIAIATH
jgi:predicted PurR-regulated permease PerM